MTTQTDTDFIRSTPKRVEAATQWLAAKVAADAAAASLNTARTALVKALRTGELGTATGKIQTELGVVQVVTQHRSRYDVEALADLVSDEIFAAVTQAVVVGELFEAQVITGGISEEIVDEVVSISPVLAISKGR